MRPEALRNWNCQTEADHGERDYWPSTSMLEENHLLAKENADAQARRSGSTSPVTRFPFPSRSPLHGGR
ncbi:hypothetical protein Rhow_009033 [Rhodococcus wratislaviensis]|uniref:Uncharacterized protein n=1 Tax=Rhodococcus wratislaviensis TaxID=44752 RepID=A0A402CLP5_RHOWR|nr:hypothetical protein Rhow_009033 [Rhodococcus wratislaviensis]